MCSFFFFFIYFVFVCVSYQVHPLSNMIQSCSTTKRTSPVGIDLNLPDLMKECVERKLCFLKVHKLFFNVFYCIFL